MNQRTKTLVTQIPGSHEDLKQLATAGSLYAVVDACDEPAVPPKMVELKEDAVSLYVGLAERDYWAISPYVCKVAPEIVDWILDNLWTHPWGFFCVASTDLARLRKHFRRFLMIKNTTGKLVYFRYYDPRVLGPFLSACDAAELESFFGPVSRFAFNTEPGNLTWVERSS
jgi:hypothetical protein